MKKRVFSVILCVMMLVAILPKISVAAATPLTHLDLKGFAFPEVGNLPAYLSHDEIYVNGKTLHNQGLYVSEIIFWDLALGTAQMDNYRDEFKADNPYKMTVKLQSSMQEADAFDHHDRMTATINGLPAKVYRGNYPYERIIECTYENMVEITGILPSAGDQFIKSDFISRAELITPTNMEIYGLDFRINGTSDFLQENDYFDSDREYRTRIYVRPTSGSFPAPKTMIPIVDQFQGEVFGVVDKPEARCIEVVFRTGSSRTTSNAVLVVPEPKAGDAVNLDISRYQYEMGEYYGKITKVVWGDLTNKNYKAMNNGEVFKPGHTYEVKLEVTAHPGWKYDNKSNMVAFINGNKARIEDVLDDRHNKKRQVSYTFPALSGQDPDAVKADTVITNLDYTSVVVPQAGILASRTANVSKPEALKTNEIGWLESGSRLLVSDTAFQAGKAYIFYVDAELKDGYVMAANPLVTVNGIGVNKISVENAGKRLRAEFTFPAIAGAIKQELPSVEVNGVLPPMIGQRPSTTTTGLVTGSNYYIMKVEWQDENKRVMTGNAVFEENKSYTVNFHLAAQGGSQFAPANRMTGKVNHQTANVYPHTQDGKMRILSYTFPKLVDTTQPNSQIAFLDVKPSDWFYPNVQYVVGKGIMNGIGNNMFDPAGKMTRGMIVTMVYRIAGSPAVSGNQDFTDNIQGQWFTNAVKWTYQKNLASDFLGNRFEPMANLTREQMITILYKYAKLTNKPLAQKGSLSSFADASELEKYAEIPMKWAVQQGIIKGTGGNYLNPKGNISRAEVAAIIQRFNELR